MYTTGSPYVNPPSHFYSRRRVFWPYFLGRLMLNTKQESTHFHFQVFGVTQLGIEPTSSRTQNECTIAVQQKWGVCDVTNFSYEIIVLSNAARKHYIYISFIFYHKLSKHASTPKPEVSDICVAFSHTTSVNSSYRSYFITWTFNIIFSLSLFWIWLERIVSYQMWSPAYFTCVTRALCEKEDEVMNINKRSL